jgi:hypothetical protein
VRRGLKEFTRSSAAVRPSNRRRPAGKSRRPNELSPSFVRAYGVFTFKITGHFTDRFLALRSAVRVQAAPPFPGPCRWREIPR